MDVVTNEDIFWSSVFCGTKDRLFQIIMKNKTYGVSCYWSEEIENENWMKS